MAKRKNPLKNLDEFLKQEATTIVTPEKISLPHEEKKPEPLKSKAPEFETTTKENILAALAALAHKEGDDFRTSFYSIIHETLEALNRSTSEDKMLINTLLYLKDKTNWKTNIQDYWSRT